MPRWSLVVLGVGATLLAVLPFGLVPSSYQFGARWAITIAVAIGSIVAGKANLALWCGLFAALAVLFQPLFPIDLKHLTTYAEVGAAIIVAVCVIRHW